jgi:hypothetical protein
MWLDFMNSGSLPSVGLVFEHKYKVFDQPLPASDENSEMAKVKQAADKRRGTSGDSEIQPTESFSLSAKDPDNILVVKKEGSDLTHYLFAVLEYKDTIGPTGKWWVTEICLVISTGGTAKCSSDNKIYSEK